MEYGLALFSIEVPRHETKRITTFKGYTARQLDGILADDRARPASVRLTYFKLKSKMQN